MFRTIGVRKAAPETPDAASIAPLGGTGRECTSLIQAPLMPKLDSYLFREFAQTTFAALVVLMIVSLGAVFTDVLSDIARGRVPAGMMLVQLGLQVLN